MASPSGDAQPGITRKISRMNSGLVEHDMSSYRSLDQEVSRSGLNIDFFCVHMSGHMIPILNIAEVVAKRGHSVRIVTADFGVRGIEDKVKRFGAVCVGLDMGGLDGEALTQAAEKAKKMIFVKYAEVIGPPYMKSLQEHRPDVIVADFASLAGMHAAKKYDIPLVINLPGPVKMCQDLFNLVDPDTQMNFAGFHWGRTKPSMFGLAMWLNMMEIRSWFEAFRLHLADGALILVQTIWSLDRPMLLPPNFVVTGPVLPPLKAQRQKLEKEHPQLYKFLHASGTDPIIYVTTGSLVELKQWMVEAIYYGLKKVKCRVVWSLKVKQQEFLPDKSDPAFHISAWTPQAELLADPTVKAVITHCGWGGTLETMCAAKPVVVVPFFGDQPDNADLLVKSGVGEYIAQRKVNVGLRTEYKVNDFTAETVAAAVTKILRSDTYAERGKEIANAARASGGAEAAAQQIEWAGRYGTKHLKMKSFSRISGTSPSKNPYTGIVLLSTIATLGVAGAAFAYHRCVLSKRA